VTTKRLKVALAFSVVVIITGCQAQGTTPVYAVVSSSSLPNSMKDGNEQSVAYQINAEHTGYARGPLKLPLKKLWKIDLPGWIGYPVIANGIVVVAAGRALVALDEKTGKKIWSQRSPQNSRWVSPAYDNGKIFVDPSYVPTYSKPGMYAFDELTGAKVWSAPAPGQSGFTSPPTAAYGAVYAAAAGVDGTMYAYNEKNGALKWTAAVMSDESSPAVTQTGVFISANCPEDFRPSDGTLIWGFKGPCESFGSIPVLFDKLLFAGTDEVSSAYNGIIVNSKNGKTAGTFSAVRTPAFANGLGFFVNGSTLKAESIPKMKQIWTVTLTDSGYYGYVTPPLVVGDIVYITTEADNLLGYDINTGKQKVQIKLVNNSYINDSDTSLSFGDGELVVPDGKHLIAFQGS
jgi:outer membrane protein assembly factor BamB